MLAGAEYWIIYSHHHRTKQLINEIDLLDVQINSRIIKTIIVIISCYAAACINCWLLLSGVEQNSDQHLIYHTINKLISYNKTSYNNNQIIRYYIELVLKWNNLKSHNECTTDSIIWLYYTKFIMLLLLHLCCCCCHKKKLYSSPN